MREHFVKELMKHRLMLHGFIYAMVRDPHIAEDLLQEVSLVLWSKFSQYRSGSDFGAWARSIAYRQIMSQRRSTWRSRKLLDKLSAQKLMEAYDRRETRDDEVQSHRHALRHCLKDLQENMREIIRLRFEGRLSSKQIAQRLQRSARATDALLYRTKKTLARCVRQRIARETS